MISFGKSKTRYWYREERECEERGFIGGVVGGEEVGREGWMGHGR
jgi:hypothetical protein